MAQEKILVVGSDLSLTESGVDEALSSHQFRVLTAHGEDEAISIAISELPHVLILHLPPDAALGLLCHLSRVGSVIPSILVLEQETISVVPEFLRLGVRDCVGQPFTAAQVVQAVERVLGMDTGLADYLGARALVALDDEPTHSNGTARFRIGPKLVLSDACSQENLPFVLNLSDQAAVTVGADTLQEKSGTEYESLLRVMDAVDHAIWVVDTDLRLLALNEIASDLLGWSKEEAVGRSVCELLGSHADSASGLCQVLNQVIEKQEGSTFPGSGSIEAAGVLVETKEEQEIPVIGKALPVVRNGLVVGAICAFREVLAVGSDKHVRFEFANMASHLMRSPLSFIQAGIDLLLNGELDGESQYAILNQMRDQSQHMRDFIAELLEMSHLETGLIDIYPQPVILLPLIKRVINLVQADPSDCSLSFSAPTQFPVVAADPGKVESILLSLLRAAMRRCARENHIRVELSTRASKAVVSVIDDGATIPARQLERIFSQFYPVDDDNKMPSTYQLGLYSAKRLVELQNGRVWAKSRPGEGTRFDFSLPLWRVSQWP